jgi:hypothetical protein
MMGRLQMSIKNPGSILSAVICILVTLAITSPAPAQDNSGPYTLRFNPETGRNYTYLVSTTGTSGDNISVGSEHFSFQAESTAEGNFHMTAIGEAVPENARLGIRFQRAYWPEFSWTIDSLGYMSVEEGQPFPPFRNVPMLPSEPVSEGSTWSGGPIGILPDPNAGTIPFTYESILTSVAEYEGDMCAIIETRYTVAMPEAAQSLMPFLGLVQGDAPDSEQAGQGAPVGGVVDGSRAHKAGFQPGDIITEAEGQRIRSWGGLQEILPQLVPEKTVEFKVMRGDQEITIEVAPEGVPLASISASGKMVSTCYFSIERGIPLKTDLISDGLAFTMTNSNGEVMERTADIHIVMEYEYGGR